jgi:ABC-type nitrate/sulfonate/bicarbonate transport system permease component
VSRTLAAPAAPDRSLATIGRFLRSDLFARIASYVFLLVVWQLVALYEDRFPGPAEVFGFLWIEVTGGRHGGIVRGEFLGPFAATLPRFALGVAISMVLGVMTGIAIGGSKLAEALLKDTLLVLVALPAIVWAFLTQMWLGLGDDAVVITTFLSAFPFVAVNVIQGIQAIPRDLRRMSGAFHVSRYRRLRHMQLPAVTGYLFAGFRFAVIIGWNAVLLGEWFSASDGVGWRSRYWYDANRYKGFVGWVILFIGFIVLLDRLVLVRLQRRAFRWRDAQLSETERQAEEIDVGTTGA